uniref:Uncharacterized protein n=1 Tax=Anguilla anguilla TaxID=7936 RepID=A0A0E9VEB8_ANGAN
MDMALIAYLWSRMSRSATISSEDKTQQITSYNFTGLNFN